MWVQVFKCTLDGVEQYAAKVVELGLSEQSEIDVFLREVGTARGMGMGTGWAQAGPGRPSTASH